MDSEKIDACLRRLQLSNFRSSFSLSIHEKEYIKRKGLDTIGQHALDFLQQRLQIKPKNDTRQTPYKGHPVFVAQHATATCCRKCIQRWHHVPRERMMTNSEMKYCKSVIMTWIKREIQ